MARDPGRAGSPFLHGDGFVWAAGIEDTIIGHPLRDGGGVLDEYALTQHDRFWREDLDRAASLGVRAIRYGIPWHRVHVAPDRFDWRWTDEVLAYATRTLGLIVVADLVHYGTPLWLPGAFVDPDYPAAMAAYAGAFAARYAPLVHHFTPLNEPLVTASFCGARGVWPPYLEGERGWLRVILGVVAGIRAAIDAIRAADPEAVIVHVEAAKVLRSAAPRLEDALEIERARAFLATDLLCGRVDHAHPLAAWLVERGLTPAELDRLPRDPATIDLIGVNYYPELSVRELDWYDGRAVEVAVDGWDRGLGEVLTEFRRRYGLPLLVGETSTEGNDARRVAWLDASTTAIADLRAAGVPVRGFTWWPLFDFVDWAYACHGRPIEEFFRRDTDPDGSPLLATFLPPGAPGDPAAAFLRRMGAWRLTEREDGTLERVATPVVDRFRELTGRA